MSQTMLLNRRLTLFLSQNTTPALPTLILLSPTGKLLSSSSPLPASTLRTQATLACSLWGMYSLSMTTTITSALDSTPAAPGSSSSDSTIASPSHEHGTACITIQLEDGIMVIRTLSCGLLFVAIGGTREGASRPGSAAGAGEEGVLSDCGSTSGRSVRGGMVGVKRKADEIGKWLDGQLEGFGLGVGS